MTVMPTIPNWMPRAVVYTPGYGTKAATAYPITSYRPTKTQVVVTYKAYGRTNETRFRLDDLREIGRQRYASDRARLMAPDDPAAIAAAEAATLESVRVDLGDAVAAGFPGTAGNPDCDAETLARYATALRDAATKALADLEPLL